MTELPYPLSANGMSPDRYLLNLLAAIVKKQGGEMRLKVSDILSVTDQVLVRYPNDNLTEIVLRLGPKTTDLYVVSEAPSWTARTSTRKSPTQSNSPTEEDSSPHIPQRIENNDLRLWLLEQEREGKRAEREKQVRPGVYPFRTENR